MELDNIMNKYGTDKRMADNGYSEIYERYFSDLREKELKILEIGIFRPPASWVGCESAASLKTWRDYFPNSLIIGVDIFDFSDAVEDRIKTIIANQEKREDLKKVVDTYGPEFDIIIDDGGHTMLQQQVTLSYLFQFLKPGGIFVIEDLVTSTRAPHEYNKTNTENTTLNVIKRYIESKEIISEFMEEDEITYLKEHIEEMTLERGNHGELVFIKKK